MKIRQQEDVKYLDQNYFHTVRKWGKPSQLNISILNMQSVLIPGKQLLLSVKTWGDTQLQTFDNDIKRLWREKPSLEEQPNSEDA